MKCGPKDISGEIHIKSLGSIQSSCKGSTKCVFYPLPVGPFILNCTKYLANHSIQANEIRKQNKCW